MIGILKGELVNNDNDFFAISALNKLVKTDTTATLFCDNIGNNSILPIKTNLLQRCHAFSFNGVLIADSILRAQDLLYATYAKKRFLYCYHLEWVLIETPRFALIKKVLQNPDIELIARSESHAQIIEKLFKKPAYIMDEWDYKVLVEIDKND